MAYKAYKLINQISRFDEIVNGDVGIDSVITMRIYFIHENNVFLAEESQMLGYRFFIQNNLLAERIVGSGAMLEEVEDDDNACGMGEVLKPEG